MRLLDLAPRIKEIDLDGERTVYRRSTNPRLGYELKPDYRDPDADLSSSYPRTNRWGQRDVERERRKPPGLRRVIVLGDSVVEGHDLADLDDTLTRRLERHYPPESTEVLNFGVSGYCTLAEVELLNVKGLQFDPDIVIVVFVENDFDNFNREAHLLGPAARRPAIVRWIFGRSALFRAVSVELDLHGYGVDQDPLAWNRNAIGENNVVEGLRLLADLARTHDFVPLVAVMPVFDDDAVRDVHFMDDGSGELVVERLARSFGIRSVRLSPTFREALAAGGPQNPRLRFSVGDGLHLSVEGHAVAAAGLFALLEGGLSGPMPRLVSADEEAFATAAALGGEEPGYGRVHNNLGLRYKSEGRLEEAEAEFRLAVRQEPELADAWNNLANLLRGTGRAAEALEHYRRAVELDPGNSRILFNLGLALQELDRRDEALSALLAAVERAPDDVDARMAAGRLMVLGRSFDEAELQYRAVVRVDPDHAAARTNLGNLLAMRGDREGAIGEFRRAILAAPERPGAYRSLIRLLETGPGDDPTERDEALRLAERLVSLPEARDAVSLELLAVARAMSGLHESALEAAIAGRDAAEAEGNDAAELRLTRFIEALRSRRPG